MNTQGWPPRYILYPAQGPPRRFTAMSWLSHRGLHGVLKHAFVTDVPNDYWREEAQLTLSSPEEINSTWTNSGRTVSIDCPCGATPKARENALSACEGPSCGRVFVLLGDRLRVAQIGSEGAS